MIISHVEGGLGNQMLDYMDFLAIKDTNPDQECYFETIVYNIKESHVVISMWPSIVFYLLMLIVSTKYIFK